MGLYEYDVTSYLAKVTIKTNKLLYGIRSRYTATLQIDTLCPGPRHAARPSCDHP